MNWNKIDKCWKEYAEDNKAELKYNELNLFHSIKCEYKFVNTTEFWKIKFIGVLWKSQQGHNRNRTDILTKFTDKSSEKTLNITNSGLNNLFTRNKFKGIEKDINQIFNRIGGKKLKLDSNNLDIKLDKIISDQSEFEKINELLTLIKNYR